MLLLFLSMIVPMITLALTVELIKNGRKNINSVFGEKSPVGRTLAMRRARDTAPAWRAKLIEQAKILGGVNVRYNVIIGEDIQIDTDSEDDVVYISLGKPVASYVEEGAETICFRRSYINNCPSGVTIVSFRTWKSRLPELATIIATYLEVPRRTVEATLLQFKM